MLSTISGAFVTYVQLKNFVSHFERVPEAPIKQCIQAVSLVEVEEYRELVPSGSYGISDVNLFISMLDQVELFYSRLLRYR